MNTETIKINVPVLARVEGEGALDLVIDNRQITELKLRIFEPPRYFEKFLEGRYYYDVPDVVARICGICPVAYQMSASHAIESIFDVEATPWIRTMRRLFYCGEWIQSHSLHIHMLAAPDFLGFNSVIEMSADYADEVRRGLKLQALGNDLIALFGARSVHPVGARIGGFSRAPAQQEVSELLQRVTDAKQDAIDLINWLDDIELPNDDQQFISVALHHEDEYAMNEGRLLSDDGLDIDISEFEQHFEEQHIDHSTALHCLLHGKPYLVGPLARINLNAAQLPAELTSLMQGLRVQFPSKNMFHSMVARAIEILYTLIEAENILTAYEQPEQSCMTFTAKAGTGYGCTEAPRGLLWHRYDMDDEGRVCKAIIVPPTSQNQTRIEEDIANSLTNFGLDKPKDALQLHAEKVIRNYDPCISCATHFLDFSLLRKDSNAAVSTQHRATSFADADMSKTAIIGIGSPQQDDDTGWSIIDSLSRYASIRSLQKKGLSLLKLDRPGINLAEHIKPYDHVLIVDAMREGVDASDFVIIDAPASTTQQANLSSHDAGVLETLQLMDALELSPAQLVIIGVRNDSSEVLDTINKLFRHP